MDFTQLLLESYEYQESLKDTTIEVNQSKLEDGLIINPDKWIESEDLKFFAHGKALDCHMILFTLTQMLRNGELEIKSTNKLQRKNIDYLEKLVEGQSLVSKKEKIVIQKFKIGERVRHNGGTYDNTSIKEFDSGTIVNLHDDGVACLVRWDNPEKSVWSEWWIYSDSLSYI